MLKNTDLRHPSRQRRNLQTGSEYPKVIFSILISYILRRRIKQTCRFESVSIMQEDRLKHSEAGVLHLRPWNVYFPILYRWALNRHCGQSPMAYSEQWNNGRRQSHAMLSKYQRTDEKPAETMNAENKFPFTLSSCTPKKWKTFRNETLHLTAGIEIRPYGRISFQ